jgi:hypothetical protein
MNVDAKYEACRGRTDDGFCNCLTKQIDEVNKYQEAQNTYNNDYISTQEENYKVLKERMDSYNKYENYKKQLTDYVGTIEVNFLDNGFKDVKDFVDKDYASPMNEWLRTWVSKWGKNQTYYELIGNCGNTPNYQYQVINCRDEKERTNRKEIKYKWTKKYISELLIAYAKIISLKLDIPVLKPLPNYFPPPSIGDINCCGRKVRVKEIDTHLEVLNTTNKNCKET